MINNMVKKWVLFSVIGLLIGFNISNFGLCSDLGCNSKYIQHKETSKELRNIMLTGYWNPTGQMIAPFSNNTYLNPHGWKGKNWEGRGFNIYSFFPKPGTYNGTFEVDYQDTWEDFWQITNEIKPIAIISFGAGAGPWEIEYNARNLNVWVPDNNPPYQPTPCPPDHTKPVGYVRHATLPVQSIADEVNNQTSVNAWVDWNGNPGAYLCEYMAYLGMWYQDIHNDTSKPDYCLAAGFIHVNAGVVLKNAMEATNVTIREVIEYLLSSNQPPGKPTIEGPEYGDTSIEYEYRISVSDPDGDNVSIYVDWGDGNIEEWVGPIKSGDNVTCNHSWMEKGSYTIKVKARDELGAVGPWGTYRVIIGVYIGIGEVTGGLLKISVNFENPSRIDAKDINWSIDLDGGLVVFGKETTGIIDILSGENKTVQSKFILGFGKTTITITATHKETSYTRDHNGYLLLFFIYINPSGFD